VRAGMTHIAVVDECTVSYASCSVEKGMTCVYLLHASLNLESRWLERGNSCGSSKRDVYSEVRCFSNAATTH
jgi:hypothetical protein